MSRQSRSGEPYALIRALLWRLRRAMIPGVLAGIGWQLAAIGLPLVLGWTVQRGIVDGDRSAIWIGAAAVAGLGVLEALLSALRHWGAITMYAESSAYLREALVWSALDDEQTGRHQAGELMGRAISDVEMVAEFADAICHTIAHLVAVPVVVVLLYTIDPPTGIVVTVAMGLLAMVMWRYSLVWVTTGEAVQEAYATTAASAEELVEGFKVVRGLGAEQAMIDRYTEASAELQQRSITLGWFWLRFEPMLEVLSIAAVAGVLWFGGERVIDGGIELGALVAAIGLVLLIADPVRTLGQRVVTWQLTLVSAHRLSSLSPTFTATLAGVTGSDWTHNDPETWAATPTLGGAALATRGLVVEAGDRTLVDGLDLSLLAGTVAHLDGPVGSGKTTLLGVLTGEIQPLHGEVLLAGRSISDWTVPDRRRSVLLCGPAPFLFGGTLADNIGFADPSADRPRIAEAAAIADVAEFADRLPDGLDSVIGERGVSLSGGQRQRIGLARAVLARPAVLLLDGATTALDPERELTVIGALRRGLPHTTIVVVSPNPGIPALAHYVVDLGRLPTRVRRR